jgi:hypothetical protein
MEVTDFPSNPTVLDHRRQRIQAISIRRIAFFRRQGLDRLECYSVFAIILIGLISIDYLSNRLRISGIALLVRADEAAVLHRILVVNSHEVTLSALSRNAAITCRTICSTKMIS